MNITEVSQSFVAYKIRLIVLPILMAFGIPGNILSIIILYRLRKCQRSTYLVCLAVADLCVLCFSEMPDWIIMLFRIRVNGGGSLVCRIQSFVYYSSLHISSWMLVLVTAERLCSVMFPHKVRILFSPARAVLSVVLIIVSILCLNSHCLLRRYDTIDMEDYCFIRYTSDHFYLFVWPWIDVTISFLLPCTLLIIGNCLIVYKLRRQKKYGFPSRTQNNSLEVRKYRVSVVTKRVVVVNLVYIICMLPISINETVMLYVWSSYTWLDSEFVDIVTTSLMMLMLVNNSVNFFLYILIGFRFRQELVSMMSACKCFRPTEGKVHSVKPEVNACSAEYREIDTISSQIRIYSNRSYNTYPEEINNSELRLTHFLHGNP